MADSILPRRPRNSSAYLSYFNQEMGKRHMMSNVGNNSPRLDNGRTHDEELNAIGDRWDTLPPEQAARYGNDYGGTQVAALPHEAASSDGTPSAQSFAASVGSMTPDPGGSGPVHHSTSDLIGDVPQLPASTPSYAGPSLLSQQPMVPDRNFSSTNPAFRKATGMTDAPAVATTPGRIGAVTFDDGSGPAPIRAFPGAENDTARFGDKLTGSGSLADVQAKAAAATAAASTTPTSPTAAASVDTTTPSSPTPSASPSPQSFSSDGSTSRETPPGNSEDGTATPPTPDNDAPGGLNDQLATSARAQGDVAIAQRAKDAVAADQAKQGILPMPDFGARIAAASSSTPPVASSPPFTPTSMTPSIMDAGAKAAVAASPPYAPAKPDEDEDEENPNKSVSAN